MTTLVPPPSTTETDDGAAIAELHRLHAVQRKAFLAGPYPAPAERKEMLGALAGMVLGHRDQIRAAMSEDFGAHPDLFTDLVEVLGVAGRAAYAIEQLDSWLAEDVRYTDPALYGTARAGVRYQPKGVVGNIVPWNFPFDLSLGPLVEMLAAGNRVIIKPSDYTPACGELLRSMVAATFGEDRVAVAVGGLTLAKEFPHAALGPPAVHRQPGDRPRGGQGRRGEPGPGNPGAGRQVPGHHGPGQRRRVQRAQRDRHQADQERPDVHLGGLRAGPPGRGGCVRRPRAGLPQR
jgi:hypothetical protein